ncbi:MAG: LicD family protein [Bacteroidales bacterium]|nr:LicD family protein [Bacteroidales bacterium]
MNKDFLAKIAIRLGVYEPLMKLDTKLINKRQNKAFIRYGLDALVTADKVATDCGAQLFLCFGSLLGAYREKGWIPFDYDLDTGMMYEQRPANFPQMMEAAGFTLLRSYYIGTSKRITEDKFDYKGVHIDVHYYYNDDKEHTCCCELTIPHESKDWRTANATDGFPSIIRSCPQTEFERGNFLGHQIYMPVKTKEWLETLYGESFMTPDPKWTMNNHKKLSTTYGERVYRTS